MRILWVKVGGLWPANSGGRLRSFHTLSELSQKHNVTVVTTQQPGEEPGELARHLPRCEVVITVPYNAPKHDSARFIGALVQSWFSPLPVDLYKNRIPAMRRAVTALLRDGNFDLCVADFLTALPNVPVGFSPLPCGPVPVVLFTHNVEHMIWKRLCSNERNPLKRLLLALEWRKMRHYELRACQLADLTLTVSETDKILFKALSPACNIHAVSTGVDVNYFSPASTAADQQQDLELVFSGSMDWFPNEDAMQWFLDSILPLIRAQNPAIRLTIVGRNPSARLQRWAAATYGVRVTGTVDDVRPSVHRASVYIVPLRVGGGTRLKIFEALAMGKAIVSTTVGAEGLPLEDGKHLVLADTPADFARQVLALIANPEQRARLGRAGRDLVQAQYSWGRVARDFEALCRNTGTAAGSTYNNHIIMTGESEI